MLRAHRRAGDLSSAQPAFNTATGAIGALYLATHSIVVTLVGTVAATAMFGWGMWLAHRREPTATDPAELQG